MQPAALPPDEPNRLATLRRLALLDTPPEERFDRIARVAAALFDAPIALVTLVDANRQWFKSCFGLPVRETDRGVSFCAHAILGSDVFVIPDARADDRFADNPLVTAEPHIRFYAGHPLRAADGTAVGTLCVIDRRPRTVTADQLDRLGDLARWAEQELNHLDRRQVERLKDEIVSVVSHELRTPLTSIRGSLGVLAGGLVGALPPEAAHMVDIAVENTDRLVRLVDDVLDLRRIESGAPLSRRPCAAAGMLADAVAATAALGDAAGVELQIDPVDEGLEVDADHDRIVQVLTGLVGNAAKFSPPGSVVRLGAEAENGAVVFSVRDQGRGIPPDQLERIFEPFEQVDGSDAREKGGTGLGLAIARSIVEQHGGSIWVESEVDRGSVFRFTVPARQPGEPGDCSH
ncbi:MAG TPA: GAF domain-containing sensor histidine kinase [Acidimicrobiia bacterium]|nr:GAF domain-containing sensor histidine kinase [Acidimicrobiia bacterium]